MIEPTTAPLASLVSVVIVTYNSSSLIADCLDAIPAGLRVIVVDNASPDDTASIAEAHPRQPVVIRMEDNQGFGRAANRGLAMAETDFGLLLNVDLVLGPGCIDGLLAAAKRYPDAAILSPEIREPDGQLQFGRHPHLSPLFPAHGWSDIEPAGDCCAAYAGGASMFIRLQAFRDVGCFDDQLFLFGDDDDLCLRLTKAKWSLIHVAGVTASHLSGGSSSGVDRLLYWKQWHMAWSRLYLESKHVSDQAGRKKARADGLKLAAKALFYGLLGRSEKAERYRGRRDATKAFLAGVMAQDIRLGSR